MTIKVIKQFYTNSDENFYAKFHLTIKSKIAHTKLLGGGESDTIEFMAPPIGSYEFLCTFPGHSGLMEGTFIVE